MTWYAQRLRISPEARLKAQLKGLCVVVLLVCVSGCSWFHRKAHAPAPTELIVTGAPVGSIVFIDGVQAGQAKEIINRPQEVEVSPGMHTLEVRMGDTVAYRENTYVAQGDKRVISVLSGRM
jgi:hypothetical protein